MRKLPKLGRHVRSPEGSVWKVAEVLKSGLTTYTVTCEAPSLLTKVPDAAAGHARQGVRRRTSNNESQDLAADLLLRARDAVSPRELRRKWRERNDYP